MKCFVLLPRSKSLFAPVTWTLRWYKYFGRSLHWRSVRHRQLKAVELFCLLGWLLGVFCFFVFAYSQNWVVLHYLGCIYLLTFWSIIYHVHHCIGLVMLGVCGFQNMTSFGFQFCYEKNSVFGFYHLMLIKWSKSILLVLNKCCLYDVRNYAHYFVCWLL